MKRETDEPSTTAATPPAFGLATQVVVAYLQNAHNRMTVDELPKFLTSIVKAFDGMTLLDEPTSAPAVAIKKSITREAIICLEDGKPLRTLKRYLRSHFNMSPDDYRKKWNLPADYPMVAPAYAELRSAFAKKIGLGRKRKPKK